MKKKHIIFILVVLLTFSMSTAAFAKKGGETVTGTIVSCGPNEAGTHDILTINTGDEVEEDLVVFTLPEGLTCENLSYLQDETVTVIGEWNLNDEGEAVLDLTSIAPAEPDEGEEEDEDDEDNGWGPGGVYCNGGKETMHPVARKISEKYEGLVDPAWVMEMVCNGFGFGEVMLAIQTQLAYQKKNGEGEILPGEGCVSEEGGESEGEGNPCNSLGDAAEEWLNHRKAGQGWGQIWKDNELVKKDKSDNPPPGLLKKQDQDAKEKGPKEGKGHNKGEDHPSNNSNRPEKEDKNNKNKDDEGD